MDEDEDEYSDYEDQQQQPSLHDETIKDRLSTMISHALGSDYEDHYIFDENEEPTNSYDSQDDIFQNVVAAPTKISVNDKLRSNKQNVLNHKTVNRNESNSIQPAGEEVFKFGNVVVSEAKARLLGLSIKDLDKKFNKTKITDNILPEPKSLYSIPMKKKSFKQTKLQYSKESERIHCIFKPKEKSAARRAAAKAAGFGNAGDHSNNDQIKSGFKMKEETSRDREVEQEKAFCRRQDAFINSKKNEMGRLEAEKAYDEVLDCDKKRCPNCGNLQTYEEILKKEKKCRGEQCNGAAYVRGITFNAAAFLKRQEEHKTNSEAQLAALKNKAEEEHVRKTLQTKPTLTVPTPPTNRNNTSYPPNVPIISKPRMDINGKKHYEKDIRNIMKESEVMRDLRTPRYLSREIQQQQNNENDQNRRRSNNKEETKFKSKKYVGNHCKSQLHAYDNARNCEIQMMQHLEEMVGTTGCDEKAHKFVYDTYHEVLSKNKNKQFQTSTRANFTNTSSSVPTVMKKEKKKQSHLTQRKTILTTKDGGKPIPCSASSSVVSSSSCAKVPTTGGGIHQPLRRGASVRGADPWGDLLT